MPNEILAVGDEQIAEYEAQQESAEKVASKETQTNDKTETQSEVETALNSQETTSDELSVEGSNGNSEESEAIDEHKHYFGDIPVEIEVPQEVAAALSEHKIDAGKLVDELFAKDGKFELSDASRKALDKAFGKHIVDGYLGLYKQQNQIFMDNHQKQAEETRKTVEANSADFESLVGGDDGWHELNEWAADNLNDSEIANLNAVMSLPVGHYQAQRAVIEALQIKREKALADAGGDTSVTLLTDTGGSNKSSTGALPQSLTREEFQALYTSERYAKDPQWAAQVDNIRRRSQAAEKSSRR